MDELQTVARAVAARAGVMGVVAVGGAESQRPLGSAALSFLGSYLLRFA
ncbi:MAG: hypothetical protein R2722_05460 [Tessaracoccus sp.]